MPKKRIVVALDVDGVINIDVGDPVDIVVMPEDRPQSPFLHGHPDAPLTLPIRIAPGVGDWINKLLSQGVEVVWATTWEHAANIHLAPMLGIPHLPVAVSVAMHPPRFGHVRNGDSAAWKVEALSGEYGAETVLVWVDDSAWNYQYDSEDDGAISFVSRRWRGPTLVVTTSEWSGLNEATRLRIDRWIGPFLAERDAAG